MRFIVTGSEGFIGKALCNALHRTGCTDVIGIDRKNGTEVADIAEYLDSDITAVFHLAAQTSVFNPAIEQIRKDNIDDFITVCRECKKRNIKLVYASSSTANPSNTTSMYGITKHFDEQYAQIYCPDATGVRFHNVYGPKPRQGTLLWHLMNDGEVILYNHGKNRRRFTYIDDVIEGLKFALGCKKQLINICNSEECSVLEFCGVVKEYKDFDLRLSKETRAFDNLKQTVDESFFTVNLSYTPIRVGIKRVFEGLK